MFNIQSLFLKTSEFFCLRRVFFFFYQNVRRNHFSIEVNYLHHRNRWVKFIALCFVFTTASPDGVSLNEKQTKIYMDKLHKVMPVSNNSQNYKIFFILNVIFCYSILKATQKLPIYVFINCFVVFKYPNIRKRREGQASSMNWSICCKVNPLHFKVPCT